MTISSPVALGRQRPSRSVGPKSRESLADDVIELAGIAGLVLDDWQRYCLDVGLRVRPDGKWAATEVGLSVPRQNGKGSILEALELGALFLWNDRLILHSAHEYKTAAEAFRRVLSLIDGCDYLRKKCKAPRTSHGEEGIETLSGNRLRFVARSKGSGRGFTGDRIILDEAYNLPAAAVSAMFPTLSARPNPQIWYTSSPPATLESITEHYRSVRARALSDSPGRLAWLEWSDPDPINSNPGYGIRIDPEWIETERESMTPEAFLVERCGIWPDESLIGQVIDPAAWVACYMPKATLSNPVTLAIDVTPDRSAASIAAAGSMGERIVVDLVDHREGVRWVIARTIQLMADHKVSAVIIDPRGPVGSLLPELDAAKVPVKLVNTGQYGSACGAFFDAVAQTKMAHIGQPDLDEAVAGARKKAMGDAWKWDRSGFVDISPLIAATLAMWGHALNLEKPKARAISMADLMDRV